MICASHTSLRYQFSQRVQLSVAVSFVQASPDTITRAAGSFTADGLQNGMSLDVSGATNGANNRRTTIVSAGATTLTLNSINQNVNEGPVTCTLVGAFRDVDSFERWPYALVRAAGFDDGLTTAGVGPSVPSGVDAGLRLGHISPLTLSINNYAADAVAGVDDYDWYLSQRTDDPLLRPFDIVTPLAHMYTTGPFFLGPDTYSGTIRLSLTSAGTASNPGGTLDAQMDWAWKNAHLYCRRRSDGAIQWFDLHALAFS